MSFQIRKIVIYSVEGEPRDIDLQIGAVNIVTGASKTGKTTLLDIVDYCLGSRDFPVTAGVVRSNVSAYGLVLQNDSEGLLVIRFAPRKGYSVSTQFHLRTVSPEADLPQLNQLPVNADLDTTKFQLSAFADIVDNVHIPESGTRSALRATIRHTLFFCLQGQDEIASRNLLFHSQASEHTPQAIRDVLPFFLGAVPDDHIEKLHRARQLRRELRDLRRGAAERDQIRGPSGREEALIAEAVEVGLFDSDAGGGALERLQRLMNSPEPEIELPGPSSFTELAARRRVLRNEFSQARAALENLRAVAAERRDFVAEANEQRSRLSLGDLFGQTPTAVCPVCDSELGEDHASVEEIQSALGKLSDDMSSILSSEPEMDSLIGEAEDRLAGLSEQLRANKTGLDEAERSNQVIAQYQDAALQRATVRGRISLYLGSRPEVIVDHAIDERIAELGAELEEVESELDSDDAAARLESALSRVNAHVTEIARQLQLEHSESPTRLDIRRLTVVADTPEGPVPLNQMGSGENWVGYHLSAILGLHRVFVEADRPVPRFLILDQPSQIYFPPDSDDPDVDSDEDRAGLKRMLDAVRNEVERSGAALQVLIVDHADIDEPWFQDSVVERWRGGPALVPASWLQS
jgi:hypothetical protein